MGVFTNIEAALNTKLSTLTSSPPVQWPNMDYSPAQGTVYLRPTVMPATGDLATLQGQYLHKGLYQIDVFCPINKGIATLTGWLDAIQALFTATKQLTAGTDTVFIQHVSMGKSDRQEGWFVGFITIQYICYS
jgi:hypothetical protein